MKRFAMFAVFAGAVMFIATGCCMFDGKCKMDEKKACPMGTVEEGKACPKAAAAEEGKACPKAAAAEAAPVAK